MATETTEVFTKIYGDTLQFFVDLCAFFAPFVTSIQL